MLRKKQEKIDWAKSIAMGHKLALWMEKLIWRNRNKGKEVPEFWDAYKKTRSLVTDKTTGLRRHGKNMNKSKHQT